MLLEVLIDYKNDKGKRDSSAPQLAESLFEVYFPSKAVLANMSHFNDT